MANDKPFFLSQNSGLGQVDPKDELLHSEKTRLVKADSATETQYFGFCVPEHGIHAFAYLWHHPNLKTLTGGIAVWRGFKPNFLYSELSDVRSFMSDAAIGSDLHEYQLDNGYGVKVVEPLKRHHLTYADPARANHVDLHFEAVLPPVMFGDGNHFEQAMKARGELVLRGERYVIDCYSVRDRSWGKARPEENMPMPPYSWMVGVFSPDFAFNCGIFDQTSGNPELQAPFLLPEDKTLTGGWLQRDGKLGRLIRARKRVVRAQESRLPLYVELVATDEHGRELDLRGTTIASNVWQAWGNINLAVCLMRWESAGQVAYGDCQEGLWNDYLCRYAAIR